MSTKTGPLDKLLLPSVLLLHVLLLAILFRNGRILVTAPPSVCPPATPTPGPIAEQIVTFTEAAGRQDISLGKIKQPGRYILQLANDAPPYSNHWLEWDYLALKAGNRFLWQIGQSETPPDTGARASDEFCNPGARTDCATELEAIAGRVDARNLARTLNDGEYRIVRIGFSVTPEETDGDLLLTLSTLYAAHAPDIPNFPVQVTLQGPF